MAKNKSKKNLEKKPTKLESNSENNTVEANVEMDDKIKELENIEIIRVNNGLKSRKLNCKILSPKKIFQKVRLRLDSLKKIYYIQLIINFY